MSKKHISGEFMDAWNAKLYGKSAKEQLEVLLPAIRSLESEACNAQGKASFLKEIAKDVLTQAKMPDYVTDTKRTMGLLSWPAQALSGAQAALKARRIRHIVKRVLGEAAASKAVTAKRKVSWEINWKLIEKGGPELVDKVRKIVGVKKPTLEVGPVSKMAKKGQKSKRRAAKSA